MKLDLNKKTIIDNENNKYIIYEIFDVIDNFTLFICKKKKIFSFNNLYKNHFVSIVKLGLSEYLHDEITSLNLNCIFGDINLFATIDNKLIIEEQKIKEQLETLKLMNMLTKNYEYDDWYPNDDFYTNYLNFMTKKITQ